VELKNQTLKEKYLTMALDPQHCKFSSLYGAGIKDKEASAAKPA
jgi:hypothetical protein